MNKLNHIAFIMDGNGRWGKNKNKGRNYGHLKGVETVKKIVGGSIKLKIPYITFFVFSSENWKRPKAEIRFLFKLIKNYFHKEIDNVTNTGNLEENSADFILSVPVVSYSEPMSKYKDPNQRDNFLVDCYQLPSLVSDFNKKIL